MAAADGAAGAEIPMGGGAGVLPALPQQVQPDRAAVGHPGELLARGVVGHRGSRAGLCGEYDVQRCASPGASRSGEVRQGGQTDQGAAAPPGGAPPAETGAGKVGDRDPASTSGPINYVKLPKFASVGPGPPRGLDVIAEMDHLVSTPMVVLVPTPACPGWGRMFSPNHRMPDPLD